MSRRPDRPGVLILAGEQEPPVAVEVPESAGRHRGLTEADVTNLNSVFEHEVAETTRRNYRVQWQRFAKWALDRGVTALPADPVQVATYLVERMERDGHRPATLQGCLLGHLVRTQERGTRRSVRRARGEEDSEERHAQGGQLPEAG